MEVSQMIELMKAVSEYKLTDFTYEENGVVLKIRQHAEKNIVAYPSAEVTQAPVLQAAVPQTAAPAPAQSQEGMSGNVVKSPLVGTFYAAPSPEAAPYVSVGDTVKKGQVLGIVEAMKLMNEIESEFDGVVKEILVKNGDVIEYDQPMFVIG